MNKQPTQQGVNTEERQIYNDMLHLLHEDDMGPIQKLNQLDDLAQQVEIEVAVATRDDRKKVFHAMQGSKFHEHGEKVEQVKLDSLNALVLRARRAPPQDLKNRDEDSEMRSRLLKEKESLQHRRFEEEARKIREEAEETSLASEAKSVESERSTSTARMSEKSKELLRKAKEMQRLTSLASRMGDLQAKRLSHVGRNRAPKSGSYDDATV